MSVPALPVTAPLARRLSGAPLLLLLDLDGTLAPIAPRPEYAVLPAETKRVLCDLVELPEVRLVIVSGRAADDARRIVGVPEAWVIGNHGFERARPGAPPQPRPEVAAYEAAISTAATRAEALANLHAGVIIENKHWTLSVHYRLAHPRVIPELTQAAARIAADLGLWVTEGKEVLELRPPIEVNKGVAALELARALGALAAEASILCAGDDRTDEDAFRILRAAQPDSVTVRVGAPSGRAGAPTEAEFSVPDTAAMRELLEWVLRARPTDRAAH